MGDEDDRKRTGDGPKKPYTPPTLRKLDARCVYVLPSDAVRIDHVPKCVCVSSETLSNTDRRPDDAKEKTP